MPYWWWMRSRAVSLSSILKLGSHVLLQISPIFGLTYYFTHNHIHHHDGHNDGEGYAERRIGIEKIAIKAKADGPNQEFQDAYTFFLVVFMDKKVIRQHDGRHRSKDGTDEIEKVFKAAGVNGDGKECAKGRCDEGLSFFRKACCQGRPDTPAE